MSPKNSTASDAGMKIRIRVIGGLGDSEIGFGSSCALSIRVSEGSTVRDVLRQRTASPDLAFWRQIYDPVEDCLVDRTIIFLNNRAISLIQGLDTLMGPGDALLIGKTYSGG